MAEDGPVPEKLPAELNRILQPAIYKEDPYEEKSEGPGLEEVEGLLLKGLREEALALCEARGLWGLAMMLAEGLGAERAKKTKALFCGTLHPRSARFVCAHLAQGQLGPGLEEDWRTSLCALLGNAPPNWRDLLRAFGDQLLHTQVFLV